MDNNAFSNTCRDFHEDMLNHHDLNQNCIGKDFAKILNLIENFPPLEAFVVKMRIWIPSRIILLALLIVTTLEWPKSSFIWVRNSQIRVSSPNPILKWVVQAKLVDLVGQTMHEWILRLAKSTDRVACLVRSTNRIRIEEVRVACLMNRVMRLGQIRIGEARLCWSALDRVPHLER